MEALNNAVSAINGVLWSSVIIVLLVGAGFYFTVRTRGVQIRFFGRMFSLIAHTAGRKTRGMRFLLSRPSASVRRPG
jgi:AGCS family alanine or glycine:cation symporter